MRATVSGEKVGVIQVSKNGRNAPETEAGYGILLPDESSNRIHPVR